MTMGVQHLFIDELGNPDPKVTREEHYIISGCSMPDEQRDKAKALADQIKFKYWGRTNIVFHSREVGKNEGSFAIFKHKPQLKNEFIKDLLQLFRKTGFVLFIAIANKEEARHKTPPWDKAKITKDATTHIVESFVLYLVGCKAHGKIVIESGSDEQNQLFLKAFRFYLSPKAIRGIPYQKIQESLTSMSFVTKKNFDIEEQFADLFAYAAKCKFRADNGQATFSPNSYEGRMIKILENKLFKTPPNASTEKKRIYNKIDSFRLLTK